MVTVHLKYAHIAEFIAKRIRQSILGSFVLDEFPG